MRLYVIFSMLYSPWMRSRCSSRGDLGTAPGSFIRESTEEPPLATWGSDVRAFAADERSA
jgi:hypothetical protein